jgi:hypothetical protein
VRPFGKRAANAGRPSDQLTEGWLTANQKQTKWREARSFSHEYLPIARQVVPVQQIYRILPFRSNGPDGCGNARAKDR